jgi:hypothetical protein
MVNCGVLFEVRAEFLSTIYTRFGLNELISLLGHNQHKNASAFIQQKIYSLTFLPILIYIYTYTFDKFHLHTSTYVYARFIFLHRFICLSGTYYWQNSRDSEGLEFVLSTNHMTQCVAYDTHWNICWLLGDNFSKVAIWTTINGIIFHNLGKKKCWFLCAVLLEFLIKMWFLIKL